MGYIYNELPRSAKAALSRHLKNCADCRTQVSRWQSASAGLSEWKLETATEPALPWSRPVLRWALAASLVLGVGFASGRLSAPALDPAAIRTVVEQPLRASLTAELRQQIHDELKADWLAALRGNEESLDTGFRRELRAGLEQWTTKAAATASEDTQRLLAEMTEAYRADRRQDRQAILTLFDRSEQAHQAQYLSLRRAVETVAVVADDKFKRAASELGQLASYTQAKFTADPADEFLIPLIPANTQQNQ